MTIPSTRPFPSLFTKWVKWRLSAKGASLPIWGRMTMSNPSPLDLWMVMMRTIPPEGSSRRVRSSIWRIHSSRDAPCSSTCSASFIQTERRSRWKSVSSTPARAILFSSSVMTAAYPSRSSTICHSFQSMPGLRSGLMRGWRGEWESSPEIKASPGERSHRKKDSRVFPSGESWPTGTSSHTSAGQPWEVSHSRTIRAWFLVLTRTATSRPRRRAFACSRISARAWHTRSLAEVSSVLGVCQIRAHPVREARAAAQTWDG